MSANEAAIRDGLAAGLSFGQIARSLGRDRTTIQRKAKRLGLQSVHGCESSLTAADEETIRRRVAAGHSRRAIADGLKCNRSTVERAMRRLGLIEPAIVAPEVLDAMFDQGLRSRSVARETGAALSTVIARRTVWVAQQQSEIHEAQEKPKGDGSMLAALRAHMPPLTSLPDRVAALGIPVMVRRAA